ncbi:DNA-directed RNA polymerase III subunit RPC5-like isoform X1 [Argiope bruennichi]|uniref:DNA-directed RNA polymerase III subunit RPC5-like isoform X1 n=2 Tax=Argiope bruennichi TaxID=94029 RepID=UPI0024957223|nr:DNA-directed RNA polymerase III subunit RPC5-like isoform X1 [Argiope bruennichi]
METNAGDNFDDEVVFESVVQLTKSLSENLYLFNYPIRHNGNISQDSTCLSARIKPKQQRVELEFGIDINADNYDTSRGEQIAYNVDGQNSNGECYFNSGIMDKKLLVGTKVLDSDYNYALGFMRKGELYLTSLRSIIEVNPGYTHMDKIDTSTKKNLNAGENEGEEEEAVAVTMRFEGPNAERDRQIRQKSYQYFQQKNANEPWVNLNYHKHESIRSVAECEKLICPQVHQDTASTIIDKEDYLKELVPECLRLSGCQTSKDEDAAVLIDKPLSDQIRHLMINAHLLTFSMLAEKLPHNVDTLSIERLLQQIGVLVQGCWAVKSELLYAENTVSPYTGMSAKQLINARDYILWLFTKTRFVTRQDILSAIRVLDDDFKAIMIPLANKTNRGWEFKFPTDNEFLENHPSIQQSQDIKWNLRYNKLVKDLKMFEYEAEDPPRARQKRHSHSSVSEGDESGTDGGAPKDKSRRAHGSKKRTALSPTKSSASKPRLATLDISPTYLESSPPEGLRQELRELVGGALRQHFCMTLSEIKEFVRESPLGSVVGRTDFESVLDETLVEYGAQKLKNKWPQYTTPEILYAFAKFGNKLDRYRAALLDLFSTTARTRANLFVKKVEDELRERISEADCRQIFEEYCVYKSGFYYLKGTIAPES